MTDLAFIGDCTSFTNDRDAHREMMDDAVAVTYRTFRKHVGGEEVDRWAVAHNYDTHPARGLVLKNDWHVSYHRSHWYGRRCYYLRWSSFEHVWVEPQKGEAVVGTSQAVCEVPMEGQY